MKWFKGLLALLPMSIIVLIIGVMPTMWIDKFSENVTTIILPSHVIGGLSYQIILGATMLLIDFFAVCLVVEKSRGRSYILLAISLLMHSAGIYFTFVVCIWWLSLLCATLGVIAIILLYFFGGKKSVVLDLILMLILIYYLYAFSLSYSIFILN